MCRMDLGPPKFFWDTLDIFGSHWNDLQAGTLEHPGWPIDTSSPLSTKGIGICEIFFDVQGLKILQKIICVYTITPMLSQFFGHYLENQDSKLEFPTLHVTNNLKMGTK